MNKAESYQGNEDKFQRFLKRAKNIRKKVKGLSKRESERIAFKDSSDWIKSRAKVSSGGLKNKDAILDKGMVNSLEHEKRKK
jgi:hypothetical protein